MQTSRNSSLKAPAWLAGWLAGWLYTRLSHNAMTGPRVAHTAGGKEGLTNHAAARRPTLSAAAKVAPDEMPTSSPSSLATSLECSRASALLTCTLKRRVTTRRGWLSEVGMSPQVCAASQAVELTVTTSSSRSTSSTGGMMPAPIPYSMGGREGSTLRARREGCTPKAQGDERSRGLGCTRGAGRSPWFEGSPQVFPPLTWIRWGECSPPEMTGDSVGSTAMTCTVHQTAGDPMVSGSGRQGWLQRRSWRHRGGDTCPKWST